MLTNFDLRGYECIGSREDVYHLHFEFKLLKGTVRVGEYVIFMGHRCEVRFVERRSKSSYDAVTIFRDAPRTVEEKLDAVS